MDREEGRRVNVNSLVCMKRHGGHHKMSLKWTDKTKKVIVLGMQLNLFQMSSLLAIEIMYLVCY